MSLWPKGRGSSSLLDRTKQSMYFVDFQSVSASEREIAQFCGSAGAIMMFCSQRPAKWRLRAQKGRPFPVAEIGRAHVCTPVTNAHLVCRLMLEKNKTIIH